MQTQDEPKLIAQTLSGDETTFAELIDRYKNAVYYHCFAIVRDEEVAEDIAQDTLIAAYYNLSKYDSTHRLATWLFKIGTNKCFNHIKRHNRMITADVTMFDEICLA